MTLFYVYEHWRPDKDQCFYVGKGRGDRAYWMHNRNRFHRCVTEKLKREGLQVDVRIIASGLNEAEAFRLEIERIAFWKSQDADLANATAGGEGVAGLVMSEEARAKMRDARLGKKQSPELVEKRIAPLRGKKANPDSIRRGAEKRRGRKLDPEHLEKLVNGRNNYVITDEHRAKLSACHKGKPWPEARRKAENERDKSSYKPHSEETKQKLRLALTGKKASPETIAKRVEKLVGHAVSQETREKLRIASTGRKFSEESRRRMSESAKRRCARNREAKVSEAI